MISPGLGCRNIKICGQQGTCRVASQRRMKCSGWANADTLTTAQRSPLRAALASSRTLDSAPNPAPITLIFNGVFVWALKNQAPAQAWREAVRLAPETRRATGPQKTDASAAAPAPY